MPPQKWGHLWGQRHSKHVVATTCDKGVRFGGKSYGGGGERGDGTILQFLYFFKLCVT